MHNHHDMAFDAQWISRSVHVSGALGVIAGVTGPQRHLEAWSGDVSMFVDSSSEKTWSEYSILQMKAKLELQ